MSVFLNDEGFWCHSGSWLSRPTLMKKEQNCPPKPAIMSAPENRELLCFSSATSTHHRRAMSFGLPRSLASSSVASASDGNERRRRVGAAICWAVSTLLWETRRHSFLLMTSVEECGDYEFVFVVFSAKWRRIVTSLTKCLRSY